MTAIITAPQTCFIHVPKTGGSSITAWLKRNANANTKKYSKHAMYSDIDSKDRLYNFAVVRNPWDRMVSGYFYYKKKQASIVKNMDSFSDFIYSDDWGKTLSPNQSRFIDTDTDILYFENLAADFGRIQQRFNSRSPLKRTNASKHNHYKRYYDSPHLINIVANHYKEDIERFGYEW